MRPIVLLLVIIVLSLLIGVVVAAVVFHFLPPAPPAPIHASADTGPSMGTAADTSTNTPGMHTATPVESNPRPIASDGVDHDHWHTQPVDIRREFQAFVVSFDSADDNDGDGTPDRWAIPEWVAYQIDAHPAPLGKAPDRPQWTTDPELFAQKIAPADASYAFSKAFRSAHPDSPLLGYDRGHMCMKQIAFRRGATADAETHTMLNACPQKHEFNAGIWEDLEIKTEHWADEFGTVWVICGPILNGRHVTHWLGEPSEVPVAIPDKFYKIVIHATANPQRPAVLAFIFPHEDPHWSQSFAGGNGSFNEQPYLTSVREVETETGLDFLTALPQADQDAVETTPAPALWP